MKLTIKNHKPFFNQNMNDVKLELFRLSFLSHVPKTSKNKFKINRFITVK